MPKGGNDTFCSVTRSTGLPVLPGAPVLHVAVPIKRFVRYRVPALVLAAKDIARLAQPAKHLGHYALMAILGRADELIVFDVQKLPGAHPVLRDLVNEVLCRFSCLCRRVSDFLGVLVRPGQQKSRLAPHAVIARGCIAHRSRGGVSNVRGAVDVIDGRGDVVCSLQ